MPCFLEADPARHQHHHPPPPPLPLQDPAPPQGEEEDSDDEEFLAELPMNMEAEEATTE
jgi:hypothetical protein